jgi:hypothetical protein
MLPEEIGLVVAFNKERLILQQHNQEYAKFIPLAIRLHLFYCSAI